MLVSRNMIELEPTPEWYNQLERVLYHGSTIYFWFLFAFGLFLCAWTFKKTKEKGFLLIGMFFLYPFFGLIMREVSNQIYKEELKEIERIRAEQIDGLPVIEVEINLPVFETALVLGLFIVSRTRIKKIEPSTAPTASKPCG